MNDMDELDSWETVVLPAINVAVGIIPDWLEAALSPEVAACPLSSTGGLRVILIYVSAL